MATAPQPNWIDQAEDDQDIYDLPLPPNYPGSTVDALLEKGKVIEAREELERLLLEGINSGPGRPMTQDLMEEILAKARARAGQPSR